MSITYTYEGATKRVQVDYLQFFPSRNQLACAFNIIDIATFDVTDKAVIIKDPEYTSIVAQTAAVGPIGPQVMDITYQWVVDNIIDEIILNGATQPADYVRPALTIE